MRTIVLSLIITLGYLPLAAADDFAVQLNGTVVPVELQSLSVE